MNLDKNILTILSDEALEAGRFQVIWSACALIIAILLEAIIRLWMVYGS